MEQMEFFADPRATFTVSELTIKLRDLIESQSDLQSVWVRGEVSNFSAPKSGHWYFTLKDEGAELRCVMWRSMAELQSYLPKDGESIEVQGGISIYEARGQYQLYASEVRPVGQGALFQEFLRLKAQLEAEGLFDPESKLPIPSRPSKIGVITSPTGAALRDILNTLARRYPLPEVFLAPATVQGPSAPADLISAIQILDTHITPDVILLTRGGGSIEDLAAFNDEKLARKIAALKIPLISGVGHETDFSISDFVSDLRAPTPTAAAELATPDRSEILLEINELREIISRSALDYLQEKKWALQTSLQNLQRRSPQARILNDVQRVDQLSQRNHLGFESTLRLFSSQLEGERAKLDALNPASVLNRGYSLVSDKDRKVVHKTSQAKDGASLTVRASDGEYAVIVESKKSKK
jgi:exodeoxyribonuclease VII large subunit